MKQQSPAPVGPQPVVHLEMEPVKIEASPTQAGVQIEAFDAQELFERAGAALSQSRYADAIAAYERLLTVFPDSVYGRSALYNKGLAHRDKRDFPRAVDSFRTLVDRWPDHADAKDALFQMGACHAEQENWPTSAEVFARLLERKDLTSDDRIEALARRGFAQLKLGDLDTAEKTFRSALAHAEAIKDTERLETDFFLAFSQFNIGELTHERFRRSPIRLPERQMERDLEEKARLLLSAQRAYIGTIKYGNARWASAAGFQVGALYEEMYEAFVGAPVPSALSTEGRDLYLEELRKKIRILLEKSLRWYRENLLMVERLGVDTDWAEKTRLAYAKLVRLLDPAAPSEIGTRPERRLPPSPGLGGPGLPPPSTPPAPGDPRLGTRPAEPSRSAPPPIRQVL